MENQAAIAEKCGRCEADLDTQGSPKWCKRCRTEYQKDHKATKEEMLAARSFAEGVEAMRHVLVRAFMKFSMVPIYGGECARHIGATAPPRYGEQPPAAPGPQSPPNKTAPDVAAESR